MVVAPHCTGSWNVLVSVQSVSCSAASTDYAWPQVFVSAGVQLCDALNCTRKPTPSIDPNSVWFTLSASGQNISIPVAKMCANGRIHGGVVVS